MATIGKTKKKGRGMPFAKRLKAAMLAAGYTEGDVPKLAKRLGVSRQIVGRWLKSPTPSMSALHLVNTAKLLSVRAHWLATGEGVMQRFHASEYTREELLHSFDALEQRERVLLRDVMGLILKFSQED